MSSVVVGQTVYVVVGRTFERFSVRTGKVVHIARTRFQVVYSLADVEDTDSSPLWFRENMWDEKRGSRCFTSKVDAISYVMKHSPVPLHFFMKRGRLRFVPANEGI